MVQAPIDPQILYPDSDCKLIADNTIQYHWIVRLVSNIKHLFKDQNVFVAGDLLWYPIQADVPPVPAQAPDVMIVFGRRDGDRGSYKQWKEDNIPPQVVFEILSPSNSAREMLIQQAFYREFGVLEMFFYDPESYDFWGLVRSNPEDDFSPITALNFPWVSPTLGIRFDLFDDGLAVFTPDGERFKDPDEVFEALNQAQQERDRAFAKLKELGIDPSEL
jgi:Uma2 family endonuclease